MSRMLIGLRFMVIQRFLKNALQCIDAEYESISKREEAGEFKNQDDLDNAYYFPIQEEEIVLRAVYYELSSLIEEQQRLIACTLINKKNEKIQGAFLEDIMFKMGIHDVKSIIQRATGESISKFDGYSGIEKIRKTLNAFKHRGGVKGKKDKPKVFPEWYAVEREEVSSLIEESKSFLECLCDLPT